MRQSVYRGKPCAGGCGYVLRCANDKSAPGTTRHIRHGYCHTCLKRLKKRPAGRPESRPGSSGPRAPIERTRSPQSETGTCRSRTGIRVRPVAPLPENSMKERTRWN